MSVELPRWCVDLPTTRPTLPSLAQIRSASTRRPSAAGAARLQRQPLPAATLDEEDHVDALAPTALAGDRSWRRRGCRGCWRVEPRIDTVPKARLKPWHLGEQQGKHDAYPDENVPNLVTLAGWRGLVSHGFHNP